MKKQAAVENNELELGEDEGFDYAGLTQQETGLPYIVLIDSVGITRKPRIKPRIRVRVNDEYIPVSISKTNVEKYKPFEGDTEIEQWVIENYDILIKHWNQEITETEAMDLLDKSETE